MTPKKHYLESIERFIRKGGKRFCDEEEGKEKRLPSESMKKEKKTLLFFQPGHCSGRGGETDLIAFLRKRQKTGVSIVLDEAMRREPSQAPSSRCTGRREEKGEDAPQILFMGKRKRAGRLKVGANNSTDDA